MILSKLRAMHQFLKSANLVPQEKIDSWCESFKLIPNCKNLGHGYRICVCEYKAVFVLEKYKKLPDLPLVLISVWLLENDTTRSEQKLDSPSVEIDMEDDNTADITVEITFREEITLVEDVNGIIFFHGKRWKIFEVEVTEVATGTVFARDEGAPVTEADMPDGSMVDEYEEFVLVDEDEDEEFVLIVEDEA